MVAVAKTGRSWVSRSVEMVTPNVNKIPARSRARLDRFYKVNPTLHTHCVEAFQLAAIQDLITEEDTRHAMAILGPDTDHFLGQPLGERLAVVILARKLETMIRRVNGGDRVSV